MKKTRSTKRALIMSAFSLLLCVSMLIGSTFAWFTDSVSSTNNIIKSGNLDVELEYLNGGNWEKVTATTNVFEKDTLWEPGHTEVVYLRVSNLGTLALKYNLGINIVNEIESINVAGEELRLSDYIEFGAIDDVNTPYADRAAARAAVTDSKVLSTGYTKAGSIEAGADAQYVALVVYMPETVGNEANYRTGEVAPEINLGINLMATQYTYEKDSFDEKYDENALFNGVPSARVTKLATMPTVTSFYSGEKYTLNTGYVFNTTETYEQAQLNAHRYWHADFVATIDKDITSDDAGLAGQYDAYSADWLAFELSAFLGNNVDIPAGSSIRMLETAGITMNYQELCNIVKKFSCGAFAVDPEAMAGATLTVELRLYETTIDPNASSGSANIETGEYITIGTYSYTFDAVKVTNQAEFEAAIAKGVTALDLAAGTYQIPAVAKNKTLTISTSEDAVIEHVNQGEDGMNYGLEGSTVTFNGVTIKTTSGTYRGYARSVAIEYNNCNFVGSYTLGAGSHTFNNCNFNFQNNYVWTWGGSNVVFDGCTFEDENGVAKAILVHNTVDTEVTVKDCKFIATTGAKTWDGIDVAAVSIDPNGAHTAKVTFEGTNTVSSAFNGKHQIKYVEDTGYVTIVE